MAVILFGLISAWCAFISCGLIKLWLEFWRTGVYRGRHGYRIYRADDPQLFRVTMGMMAASIIFGFCLSWVFANQIFLFWGE